MTIEECIKRFDKLEKALAKEIPIEVQSVVSKDTVAAIHTRVTEKQQKAKGGQFSRYSTKPILAGGKTAKSGAIGRKLLSSKAKCKEQDWVTIKRAGKNIRLFVLKGGYKEIRDIEGFSTGQTRKSFEFTGQMWRSFGIKRTRKTKDELIITLGGKTTDSQDLIDINSSREGVPIIDINKTEELHIKKQIEIEINKQIRKLGLS